MADINIDLGAEGSPLSGAHPGDKVTWTNSSGFNISSFVLPTCVSPNQSPAPIANGATTRQITINSGSSGNYAYEWIEDDSKRGTRSGTIDVN